MDGQPQIRWHKVAELGELGEGRVSTVRANDRSFALVYFQGRYAALDNHCPHQGGPLGEGSIECGKDGKKWLRCPWHGWDFDPLTGLPPGGHPDSGQAVFEVEKRDDGIYIKLPDNPQHERTVSDVMAETFVNWGLKRVFGMVGHSNLGLADALRRQTAAKKLAYIGIRHEGAAAFACSGYAKLSGRPAACLAIAGPGATNLLTGLWDAKVDRAPVLALTGQIDVQVFGPGAFQEIDLASAFAPVARFSHAVLASSKHAELASLACKNAIVERDVAHLIFPNNVQTLPAKGRPAATPQGRIADPHITPSDEQLGQAVKLIGEALRPLIIVGYGARHSMDNIVKLAQRLKAPVATTFKAKGQIGDNHPNAVGVLGRSGTPIASWFMNECDLIIAFGSSFSNHTGITPKRKIIQVDFDRMALGKFHAVTLPMWGEIEATAQRLGTLIKVGKHADQVPEVATRWRLWRAEKRRRAQEDRGKGLSSALVFELLSAVVPQDSIMTVDVGNNAYSFGRYFETRRQSVLMSGYLGSIGFGFPAAMGAWAATQDFEEYRGRKVVSIGGDGGFGQYLAEFTTAVKYKMDITHILLNNSELGKISKEQLASELPIWQTGLHNPSFAAYADLCGGYGVRVTRADELQAALRTALTQSGPALVEVITDPELV